MRKQRIAGLRYIGRAWIPGVPARDLSADEAERHGIDRLLASGLYEVIEQEEDMKEEDTHGS